MPGLAALVAEHGRLLQLVAVYTQPDRPAGRGRQLRPSPVKQTAMHNEIEVYQPLTLRDEDTIAGLRQLQPDLLVVAAYGLILPQSVLDIPQHGCINVHASLLPRWRGAAPAQYAILAGDEVTGISLMQMEAGLDTGPVVAQSRIRIGSNETGGELTERLALLGGTLLREQLPALLDGTYGARAQDAELATYAPKIGKQEASIDWHQPAGQLARRVRAFNPWPVAQTDWNGRQLRIWQASALDEAAGAAPGTVVDTSGGTLRVAAGAGCLVIGELQLAGKRRMPAEEFLKAHDPLGSTLGDG